MLVVTSAACRITPLELPDDPPPLADLEMPLALFDEPDDESQRRELAPGTFSGVYVIDSRGSVAELLGQPEGIEVERVIENSPGDLAGLVAGDLLLEATVANGSPVALSWPSQWREIELENPPGTRIDLVVDRAGMDLDTSLELIARTRPAARRPAERFREEQRAGVVLRTATEVEAREAGLAPGAGAVLVGMSKASPLRTTGLRFGDLIVEIDGEPVEHPRVVIQAITGAKKRAKLDVVYVRDGERSKARVPVTSRATQWREFSIPLIYSYERDRGRTEVSALLSLFRYESTEAAWRLRLLWLIRLSGGKADRLREVDS